MTQQEFNKLKVGDIIYWVSNRTTYNKSKVEHIVSDRIYTKINDGYNITMRYRYVFNTEKEAKAEIIRRINDYIQTHLSFVTDGMRQLSSFDKEALNGPLLYSIIDKIKNKYDRLKEI